jgi:hypothetical protein
MSAVMNSTEYPAIPVPPTFSCPAKGDTALEVRTHGMVINNVHRWTRLSCALFFQPRQELGKLPQPRVRIAWAMTDIANCRLTRWVTDNELLIGNAAFDVPEDQVVALIEFLGPLEVEIENKHSKDAPR